MQLSKDMLTATAEVIGVVVSILGPIVGWIAKSGLDLSRRQTELEQNVATQADDLKAYKNSLAETPTRLTKVEDAIVRIDASMAKNESQFAAIMAKLESVSRLTAMMDMYTSMIQGVVPRAEVEARVKSVEDRLRQVESDVREGRK
jgi:uncharacterized coiled-coil protein SlyX